MEFRNVFKLGAVALGLAVWLLMAGSAQASEQVQIREVAPGSQYGATAEFIELQATADGQQNLDGRSIVFFGPDGAISSITLEGNVANGSSQRSVLIGTPELESINGVTPDYTYPEAKLGGSSGAVCYDDVDCVGWGDFATNQNTGSPAAAITDGRSITRTIARGCATALDAADDTNDSAADFALTDTSARNNTTTPTETVCEDGGGDGGDGDGDGGDGGGDGNGGGNNQYDTEVNDPDLTVKKKQRQRGKQIKVKGSAGAQEFVTVVATGKIKVKAKGKKTKRYKLRPVTKSVEAGERTVLRLKLKGKKAKKKARKALKKSRKRKGKRKRIKLRAPIQVTFTDQAGNSVTERRVARLK